MTLFDSLLAFTLAATLLTLTPGLDTALILRTASVEGRSQAFKAAMGINAGCFIWGAMVAFGLGALIAVSELAYSILKYCGAAYLCWLGVNMLLRPGGRLSAVDSGETVKTNWFVKGMLGNLLNPKIGVFYVSFLPQFIPQGHSPIAWTFGLVAIHVVLGMSWSTTMILATRPLANVLKREAVSRWMDRCTGTLFILFAAKLALSKR
nr:LysE family translocator [uncultured Enterobacter sp.]